LDEREREAAVRRIARDGDPDRYSSALFAPRTSREDLFALYAFNTELARIGELVSEPQLGEIRLQWWRDALDRGAAGDVTGNPVADAIGRTVRHRALSRASLAGLIDARSVDVSAKIMPDMAALETYLANTAGALFLLAAEFASAGGRDIERAALEPVARAAGIAYGLTGLMRAMPFHAARGRVDLPADALLRHGTSPARLLAGEMSEGLAELLGEMRGQAKAALHEALRQVASLPPATRAAFLPLALVEPYLSALEQRDPFRDIADINPLYRLWRLATYRFRGARV
jgi:15-cis-phytoene synthase